MLKEVQHVMQIRGEPKRRWFSDDYFDLIVWVDETDNIIEFQLCYNKLYDQRALIWQKKLGFRHDLVDDGEGRPGKYKATPILVPDGRFEREEIAEKFRKESRKIEDRISTFVYEKIMLYQPLKRRRNN